MNWPEPFLTRMQTLLGDEYDAYLACLDKEPLRGLRCNRLKTTPERLVTLLPIPLRPVRWCEEGAMYPQEARPAKHPLYHAGLFYIQEPSAMSPAAVLAPRPDDRVLDLCAAPGGKAVQLASYLRPGVGWLAANDISASRCKALVKNLELSGVTNGVVLNDSPKKLAARFGAFFDKILLDAPCSGEGMFRKDPDAARDWTSHKPEACVVMQRELLYYAAIMLKPGGRMVYSTCTFEPSENEAMIDAFLQKNTDFFIVPIDCAAWGFAPAVGLAGAARLWPHKLDGEGHFVCLMEKRADAAHEAVAKPRHVSRDSHGVSRREMALFRAFCDAHLTCQPEGRFQVFGTSLYLVPETLPELHGIRVARSGWYLGEMKTDRFEPSQAFAMGITKSDARYTVDFNVEDDRVLQYLKGASPEVNAFDAQADKKWVLVCVEGFPLGWGKVVNGGLKNKYPQSWIMT